MTPTTPTPALDFAQIRQQYPSAFAALISWFCAGKAFDRPLTVDTPQYDGLLSEFDTWIDLRDGQFSAGDFRRIYALNMRDLYDFFDEQGVYVHVRLPHDEKGNWYAFVMVGRVLNYLSESIYPTRADAEAAAFGAAFGKLEEMLKQKEG